VQRQRARRSVGVLKHSLIVVPQVRMCTAPLRYDPALKSYCLHRTASVGFTRDSSAIRTRRSSERPRAAATSSATAHTITAVVVTAAIRPRLAAVADVMLYAACHSATARMLSYVGQLATGRPSRRRCRTRIRRRVLARSSRDTFQRRRTSACATSPIAPRAGMCRQPAQTAAVAALARNRAAQFLPRSR
jgi:hypothetical protein